MDITKENIDELNAVIKVKLTPVDYQHKVDTALKEVQRKANMPGFRSGKVPVQLVKKMYGKSIIADELNKILNDSLYKYIADNKIEILGNPIPSKDEKVNIDWENQKDFEFKYDLGLAPQFDVELSPKDKFTYYKIKADDKLVDKYSDDIAKRYGKIIHPETSDKDDLMNGDFVELAADGTILPGGIFKTVSVFTEKLKGESLKKLFLNLKKDDKVPFPSADLQEDADYISGLFQLKPENIFGKAFQFTVKDINRLVGAELNQELFDKAYGENRVKSVEEFRNKIKEEIEKMFIADSERRFKSDVVKALLEKAKLTLPDGFLKRFLLMVNEKPLTQEQVDSDYPHYSEQLKWQLIENKILKEKQIKVSDEEALAFAKELLQREMVRYGRANIEEKELTDMATRILSKEEDAKKLYDQLYDLRMMDVFKTSFTIENKEVTFDEFFKN